MKGLMIMNVTEINFENRRWMEMA